MINDWEPRFLRQIKRILSSGLYEEAVEIHLFACDTTDEKKINLDRIICDLPKIELHYTNINHGGEYLALLKIDEFRNKSNFKILYFHTKGVYNKYKNFVTNELDNLKIESINCWVEMMEYFLLDNWKSCSGKLGEYDTVGVSNFNGWWWGNFWWTTSEHIRNLAPLGQYYHDRWSAEAWLHDSHSDKQAIKFYEFKRMEYDPHYSRLPKYLYDGTNVKGIKFEIDEAKYGWFSEQRDEGSPFLSNSSIIEDVTERVREIIMQNNGKVEIMPIMFMGVRDVAPGREKILRIKFRTNIDPENEYVISSFRDWKITL